MATTGVVRSWNIEEMQGIIDSDETPGGCWTLFNSVAVEGFPRYAGASRWSSSGTRSTTQ